MNQMEPKAEKPLLWQVWLKRLFALARKNRTPLISGGIFGLLSYGYAFTNKLVNFDEVFTLFGKGGTWNLGRWGLELMHALFPDYSMPWCYGIITLVLVVIAGTVILSTLKLQNSLLQVLLMGSLVCFPVLTATYVYMYTASSYAVSLMLAALGVWLLEQNPKKRFLPACLCLVFSVSIYQAYIALAAVLMLVLLIQRLFSGERVRDVISRGLWFLSALAVSLIAYYAVVLFTTRVLGLAFSGYGEGNMDLGLANFPKKILMAYRDFLEILTKSRYRLVPTGLSRVLHEVLLGLTGLLYVLLWRSQEDKSAGRGLLLAALTLLLPLAINCMHLFTAEGAVHTLVLYSFVCFYFLPLSLGDLCLSRGAKGRALPGLCLHGMTLAAGLIIAVNIFIANEVYLNLHLRYEAVYGFYTSVYSELRAQPNFHKHTELALVGEYQEPRFEYVQFPFVFDMMGAEGYRPTDYSADRLMEYYFGHYLALADQETVQEIAATPEFAEMPAYPNGGCMKMIGDTFVVKLS